MLGQGQFQLFDTIIERNGTRNEEENYKKYPGVWAGLDLGTTHSSLAVWDVKLRRPKLLRLDIALDARRGKYGKLVSSAVLFLEDEEPWHNVQALDVGIFVPTNNRKIKALIGRDLNEILERSYINKGQINSGKEQDGLEGVDSSQLEAALVSSSKRMLGRSLSACTQTFISQLPFSVRTNFADENTSDSEVQIQTYPLSKIATPMDGYATNFVEVFSIKPSQISSIVMHSIRESAQRSLESRFNKVHPPGDSLEDPTTSCCIRNVVIGVPAHYTRYQRHIVEHAARQGGFDGYVGTITESTAAALAYGLLTSSSSSNCSSIDNGMATKILTHVLVFDMGGGTTDVTIVLLVKSSGEMPNNDKEASNDGDVTPNNDKKASNNGDGALECHVTATSGDVALGGDDIDELLAQWFLQVSSTEAADEIKNEKNCESICVQTLSHRTLKSKKHNHRDLRRACCIAKESLCGDGKEHAPKKYVQLVHDGEKVQLSMEEFERVIEPVVRKAEETVDVALQSFFEHTNNNQSGHNGQPSAIDEVVLIGGGSRIPAIRNMLRQKFPHPPDLCTSLDACSGVAMGAATQAAIISGQLPLHEIMSALMLDAIPHTIGILVDGGTSIDKQNIMVGKRGTFIPILLKDSPTPSSNYKTFELSHPCQKGITIQVAELVGGDHEFHLISTLNFLLHKLSASERERVGPKRTIDVAISVGSDGNLTVSIFDWNDPEHLAKRRRYWSKKGNVDESVNDYIQIGTTKENMPQEQVLLLLVCIALGSLYLVVKLMFQEELGTAELKSCVRP